MQSAASALVSVSAQLLEGLAGGQRPLSSVSGSLSDLATALGVRQVMVAIDDAVEGRQVFCSGRTLLGEQGALLIGPPRACTDPPSPLDNTLGRLIVASVATAFERARSSQPDLERRPDDLATELGAATDRSARYGWGFTLVLLRLDRADDRATQQIAGHLRASDRVVQRGPREFGLLLPAAAGDDIPRILTRIGRGGAVSTFCYGLAACPGDAIDPDALLVLASSRLRETDQARTEAARTEETITPEVHASEQPLV
jgi:hypothetical protein